MKKLGISTHQNIPDHKALLSEPEHFKRKLHSYTHFSLTRTRQPLLQKPSYLEFLRDDEIIDHSVEGDELESLIAEFGSLIPNVNPNETNFGGDYFEPWISGPVSA